MGKQQVLRAHERLLAGRSHSFSPTLTKRKHEANREGLKSQAENARGFETKGKK